MGTANNKVVIGYCFPGDVSGMFMSSVLNLVSHDNKQDRRKLVSDFSIGVVSGPRIARARNDIVISFLNHPAHPDWLWMLDTDMVFPPDTLDRLLYVADPDTRPIIGGLCFGGATSGVIFPTLYQLIDPAENDGNVIRRIEDYPDDALVRVDATGAACLLIHRSVFEKIGAVFGELQVTGGAITNPHPWFAETIYGGVEFGEDWTFCMRAGQVGIDVFVHTGVKVGHMKSRVLGEEDFQRYVADREALGGDDAIIERTRRHLGVV